MDERKFVVRVDSHEKTVIIGESNGYYDVNIDGTTVRVDCRYFGGTGYLSMLIDNKSYLIESKPVSVEDGKYYARVMGRHYDLDVLDELLVAVRDADTTAVETGSHTVVSPMPGLIQEVKVAVGDSVEAGAPVVIMEAMKMQNELTTPVGGIVKEIRVAPSETVDSQIPLVLIEKA